MFAGLIITMIVALFLMYLFGGKHLVLLIKQFLRPDNCERPFENKANT